MQRKIKESAAVYGQASEQAAIVPLIFLAAHNLDYYQGIIPYLPILLPLQHGRSR